MGAQISLPTALTEQHRRAVEQYIWDARLTPKELSDGSKRSV
jgi:hypothetical protein